MVTIKKLTEVDYDNVSQLSQYAFQYKLTAEELEKKKEEMTLHNIWGYMVEGELAAKLHIIPFTCFIAGQAYKMGGINAVATWPEYRRQGLVKKLLHHSLTEMKASGQTISFLHPFSIPFYRKYGWELAFSNCHTTIPIEILKQAWDVDGYVRRTNAKLNILQSLYTKYAKHKTGMLNRDEHWWKHHVLKDPVEIVVAYDANGNAEGYLIYNVQENVLRVNEMVDCTLNAKKLLLQFMANHDSMVREVSMIVPSKDNLTLLIADPTFEQYIRPHFMARIVDVYGFLNDYLFQESALSDPLFLHIQDEFFTVNSGTYEINPASTDKKIHFHQNNLEKSGVHCDIQQLTVMLMGYKRPMELFEVGLIDGEVEAVMQLDNLIPVQQTFFTDSF